MGGQSDTLQGVRGMTMPCSVDAMQQELEHYVETGALLRVTRDYDRGRSTWHITTAETTLHLDARRVHIFCAGLAAGEAAVHRTPAAG